MKYDKYAIIKGPLITEKSTDMKEFNRVVGFIVDLKANKIQIKKAVEELFKVKVESVKTVIKHGARRYGRFVSDGSDLKSLREAEEGEKMIEFLRRCDMESEHTIQRHPPAGL